MYRSYRDICKDQKNVKTDRTLFLPIVEQPIIPLMKENFNEPTHDDKKLYTVLSDNDKKRSADIPKFVEKMIDKYNENSSEKLATDPNVWGPKAWDFLHTVSFSYPNNPTNEQKTSAMNFFMALPDMLPCKLCGEHCRQNLNKNPPKVNNKDVLSRWLVDFHNLVNKHTNEKNGTNKPDFSYEEAKKMYDSGVCFHKPYKPFNK
tara:strand:- start:176 stop:787 length:612 start_codon:yes stop_codon:yes gene_type:complete